MPLEHNKRLLHREVSILLLEQFKDWEEVKVNAIIILLFTFLASTPAEPMLSLDNIPRRSKEEAILASGNNPDIIVITPNKGKKGTLLSRNNNLSL